MADVNVRIVKQVKLRVLPSDAEAAALEETLQICNAAATWLSQQMHATRVVRKFDAHHRFYTELRARFGLAAQPTIRVIGKVADAYAAVHANITAGNCGPPGPTGAAKRRNRRSSFSRRGLSRSTRAVCRGSFPTRWGALRRCRSGRSQVD